MAHTVFHHHSIIYGFYDETKYIEKINYAERKV